MNLVEKKILLPNKLKDLVHRTLIDFEEVKDIIINEKDYLDYLEEESQGNWNKMYNYAENELVLINEKIDKLKSKKAIENSENNIKELRKMIEDYFEEMNK